MFTDPVANLKALGLEDNSIVADLGAGSGFYSLEAGRQVPRGKVYAVEVVKDLMMSLKKKAQSEKVPNVECIWGDIEKIGGTKIRDRIVDLAIVSNVLFQVEHKDMLIEEAGRILKPGGKVLFIDWMPGWQGGFTPLLKTEAKAMFEKKGFKLLREIPAGNHHYGMILVKD